MGWLTSVPEDDSATVVQSVKSFTQRRTYSSGDTYKRTNDITVTHYVGLTKTAAESYKGAHEGDSGVQEMEVQRDGDGGAYRVVSTVITYGTWALET